MTVLIPSYQPDHRLVDLVGRLKAVTDALIVIVDDGSGDRYRTIFDEVKLAGCTVLTHVVNLGKGRALKTGFQYIRELGAKEGVVCADSDGQHEPRDIMSVASSVASGGKRIVLGSRSFTGKVPLRSRFGNRLTSKIYDVATGIHISDTQTGLRGYPSELLGWLCEVPGERFEYEMNLLLEAPRQGFAIAELPVETIYLDDNKSSHFRPVVDSVKVYWPFLKFSASSMLSGVLDFLLFFLLSAWTSNLLVSVVFARIGSSLANYSVNRRFVFGRSTQTPVMCSMTKYYLLAGTIMGLNYGMLYLLHIGMGLHLVPSKLLTECLLFLLSYWFQRKYIF
ncbi:GtrA family protein [Paenibacillus sp. GCM10027627]|uniref:GtrA family protein n=1 Tax=unclassified Paenibacillus TaxID=185978 RepID=UPI003641D34B